MKNKPLQRAKKRFRESLQLADYFRSKRLNYPFAKFVKIIPYITEESVQGLADIEPPRKLCGKAVPKDLQGVTFGTLIRLQQSPKDNDLCKSFCALVAVLMDVPAEQVARQDASKVIGVANMVQKEMERIGKLFQSLQTEKSSDELRAGINNLDFGVFGLVDWYAKRMGIQDHEEVLATPWVRVWQCLRIDHDTNEFEKRYRDIITRSKK